jgi:hypothetical protein
MRTRSATVIVLAVLCLTSPARPAELTVDLSRSKGVTFVGAVTRWDEDGNARKPVNPAAKLDAPEVTARAERRAGNRWVFRNLPAGRYDLVILAGDRVRVEGFHYPPVAEFDTFLAADATAPEEARETVLADIAKSKHYENKVAPLFLAGDDRQIRVFVQLVRDQPTSFDAEHGKPVATVRHEVWQYTWRYGGWAKERRTKILDRHLLARDEFHRWTWVWAPALGGIVHKDQPISVSYEVPDRFDPRTARGWVPR